MKKLVLLFAVTLLIPVLLSAQEIGTRYAYDPNTHKVFPDKLIEIGLPLLFLFSLANLIVSILKTRAENQLKMKMIDKGVTEETLLTLFRDNSAVNKLQPLKWGLFLFALGIGFMVIHMNAAYLRSQSGFMALGILLLCVSVALLVYYRILVRTIRQDNYLRTREPGIPDRES